jgi:DNA (cytosine-5)-methyltransferase 1
MGYHRAGFDVVGVDIRPQPHYPFQFHQADALQYLADHWQEYDVIHASPPCQKFSRLVRQTKREYPDLLTPTQQALQAIDRPYIIENVPGAPLHNPTILCGAMFGLHVYRHRLFETRPWLLSPPHEIHHDKTPRQNRGRSPKGFICVTGKVSDIKYVRYAMGIDWMTGREISQAIPPAYTEWIGRQLLASLSLSPCPPVPASKESAL